MVRWMNGQTDMYGNRAGDNSWEFLKNEIKITKVISGDYKWDAKNETFKFSSKLFHIVLRFFINVYHTQKFYMSFHSGRLFTLYHKYSAYLISQAFVFTQSLILHLDELLIVFCRKYPPFPILTILTFSDFKIYFF
jgi:hypothetical protein